MKFMMCKILQHLWHSTNWNQWILLRKAGLLIYYFYLSKLVTWILTRFSIIHTWLYMINLKV